MVAYSRGRREILDQTVLPVVLAVEKEEDETLCRHVWHEFGSRRRLCLVDLVAADERKPARRSGAAERLARVEESMARVDEK